MKQVANWLKNLNGATRIVVIVIVSALLFLEAKCGFIIDDRWSRLDAEKQIANEKRELDEIKLRIRRLEELHLNAKNDKGK